MLEANKDFIFKAKNAGKTFWFSHDPLFQLEQYPDSTYALELRYLQRLYGISESAFGDHIFTSGNYYYFVP